MRNCLFRKILATGLVMLFFGAIALTSLVGNISVVAAGVTVYVDDDNTSGPWDGTFAHPYQNITSGLAHASDGDTVHVLDGTYIENVVVNKSVTLEGESKPVINGMTGHGIDITANNVTIEGFNITYSGYCIYTGASGFSIRNNVFWHDFDYDFYGFYWYISESSLAEDYTVHASVVEGNEFYMSGQYDAVSVHVDLDYGSNSGYDVEIGDIQICNNTFYMEGSTAKGIDIDQIDVDYLYGGTVSFGVLNMSGNIMYGGSYGIDFFGYLEEVKDVQASVGDVIINSNVIINQSSYGMDINYYDATYWNGTTGTYGDLVINGNTITSEYSPDAIYVSDYAYWYDFYGDALLEVGNLYIEENEIDVGGEGIYVYYSYGAYDLYNTASIVMQNAYIRYNTIYGSSYGIDIYIADFYYLYDDSSATMGDLVITDNTINSNSDGIYFYVYDVGYEMYGNSSLVIGNFLVNDNTINSSGDGIYIYEFYEIGSYMYDNSFFMMGNIQFNDNTIDSDSYGIYIDYFEYFGYYMYGTSSFVMGNVEFSGNTINSSYQGIYVYEFYEIGYDMHDNSSFTMGDILFNDNIINSGDEGIYVDYIEYFGAYLYGNSSFTMGNIEFSSNTINSGDDGIYIYELAYEFGYNMESTSSFTMGDILVNNNIINSDDDGIYVEYVEYLGTYMYGTSTFTMGNIEFSGNTINSTDYGIWLYEIDYFGYEMRDDSSFAMGDFLVNDNIINSDYDGIYLEYIEYFCYFMYGNSSFTMSDVQISSNVINSTHMGIYIEDLYEFGSYMHGTSSFTMSNIEVRGNRINSTYEGIYIQSFYHAYYMYNNASFVIGDIFVSDNIINSEGDGISLRGIYHHTRFGYNAIDNTTIITGNMEFSQNEIVGSNAGMRLADLENATIRNNVLQNCSYGIYLLNSTNNLIYHNHFINNTVQAYVTFNYTNTWDNDYPSGGNYWSDYTDVDQNSGPYQNITGSDGIWDNPYVINAYNQDRYPFASTWAWDTTPPSISDVTQDPEVPDDMETVTITVVVTDEESDVYNVILSYSTDGGTTWNNVTMQKTTENTYQGEIPGLPVETHIQYKIIAYDNAGNPAVEDNAGEYYVYTVISEFSTLTSMLLIIITLTAAMVICKKKTTQTPTH